MFERFTHAARTAVVRAQEEARDQGSPTIGAEHLLFGVLTDRAGAPAVVLAQYGVDAGRVASANRAAGDLDDEALSSLGIDLDEVRRRAEDAFGPGALDQPRRSRWGRRSTRGSATPFTSEAKASLTEALRAALRWSTREIGSSELFAGLIGVEGGTALRVLQRLGVTASADELERLVRARRDEAA